MSPGSPSEKPRVTQTIWIYALNKRAKAGDIMDRITVNRALKCVRVWEGGRNADQAYFTIKEYGSLRAAWQAAVEYESQLPDSVLCGRKKPRQVPNKNSQSNIVGVNPYLNRSGIHSGWRATWVEDTKGERTPKSKRFSFFRYGSRALSLAVEHRQSIIKKHYPFIH